MNNSENLEMKSAINEPEPAELVLDFNGQKLNKGIDAAIITSIILHIVILLLFILFSGAQKNARNYEDLNQINFIDQSYRPEVAKVLPKTALPAGSQTEKEIESQTPAVPGQVVEEVAPLDLSPKLDRSQAEIDLNRYKLETSDRELDVIRIGNKANGTQKSIDEILLEKPIALAKGVKTGVPGLTGMPGLRKPEAPITIEHRPIEKPKNAVTSEAPKSDLSSAPVMPITKGTKISIAGLISKRPILNKVLPKYPEWALQKGLSGAVMLRVWVLPDGSVKPTIQIEQSSGYPELDQTVIAALTGWHFAPLPKDVVQETQWGIITFRFTLI